MSVLLTYVLGITGCAAPSTRIASALERYGLDERQSACVGNRLGSRLSIGQLQQLGRAARAYGANDPNPGRLTVSDLMRVSGTIEDPKVPIEVGKAAASCGLLADAVFGR